MKQLARGATYLVAAMLLIACEFNITIDSEPEMKPVVSATPATLPAAISNNAAALVEREGGYLLLTFGGLVNGKTWQHVSNKAWGYDSATGQWTRLAPIPGAGRLAATAQTVAGTVYLFGGYAVAQDGSETSLPQVWRYNTTTNSYDRVPPMPVPVDDTVSAVYQDRYVYLVSGWHDNDNVDNVQILDTQTDTWLQATPFPGRPVFGHAGGIGGNLLVICDGVTVRQPSEPDAQRSFAATSACYRGVIDAVDPTRIAWRRIPGHPGAPHYRAAAAAVGQQVVFAGGSINPYNFDGIGYDGVPSSPSNQVFSYSTVDGKWQTGPALPRPSMDHRNLLLRANGMAMIVGGMGPAQKLLTRVTTFKLAQSGN